MAKFEINSSEQNLCPFQCLCFNCLLDNPADIGWLAWPHHSQVGDENLYLCEITKEYVSRALNKHLRRKEIHGLYHKIKTFSCGYLGLTVSSERLTPDQLGCHFM